MKRIALLAALLGALMALPSTSSALTNCDTFDGPTVPTTPPIKTEAGGSGVTGGATLAVGACVDDVAPAQGFYGGYAEAGANASTGQAYVIVDGDDLNTFPNSSGYIGISNYETGTKGSCSGGTGTNSGGCFQIRDVSPPLPVPLIACGNTTGPSWPGAGRDGCVVP